MKNTILVVGWGCRGITLARQNKPGVWSASTRGGGGKDVREEKEKVREEKGNR